MKLLISGGAGFIGSHVVRHFVQHYPHYELVNLDKLTYAGNLANLADVAHHSKYQFVKGDICDKTFLNQLFEREKIDAVIHLAAESHVDRSISGPDAFVETNIVGTSNLLGVALDHWKKDFTGKKFYQVSTDEVFGSLGATGKFSETSPYDPRSPYSASKAGADHLVRAFYHTYGLPVVISNCSNNFGSHQFPEKLIPLMIHNIRNNKELPVYGQGVNVRDWLWVNDHVRAIDMVFHRGAIGSTYCVGGNNEWKNIDLVRLICQLMDARLQRPAGSSEQLIRFVTDRPGHDARYAIDSSRIQTEIGWQPTPDFERLVGETIDWYLANDQWLLDVTSGAYMEYYDRQYKGK